MLPNRTPLFEFLLFDGFSNMVLANAMEPLRDVKRRASNKGVTWKVSTLNGASVQSSSGLKIAPDCAFDASQTERHLVLVAGYEVRDHISTELSSKLRKAARNADMILALDTAPWLMATAGLLDGHEAAIHWQELDAFTEAFPRVKTSNARYVRSGKFLTCGGASTVLDMTLDLIQNLYGSAAAFEASNMFVYNPATQYDLNRGAQRLIEKGSTKVLQALNTIAENVETPLSTIALAKRVSTSERTLNRIFTQELGITPGTYYRLFRLQRARYLAEETELSIEQIALRCGFSSASSLGRSFRSNYGISIRKMRLPQKHWNT